jgi:hypothetical protein
MKYEEVSYSFEESKVDHSDRRLDTILVELDGLFIDYYENFPSQKLQMFTDAEYRKPGTSTLQRG